jgi:hypothetical protein
MLVKIRNGSLGCIANLGSFLNGGWRPTRGINHTPERWNGDETEQTEITRDRVHAEESRRD